MALNAKLKNENDDFERQTVNGDSESQIDQ